jgi:hypothetical protein
MDEQGRPSPLRSFLIGGLVGASAAIAAARRLRPRQRRRVSPAGLSAFERAPCFREIVELEEKSERLS